MADQPRIALLNDSFPPTIDGVANVVTNYARILHDDGYPVMVATPEYPGVTDDYPYPVLRYASMNTTRLVGYRAGYPFSARAVSAIDDFHPDILHTHCPVASTLLARTAREGTGAPVVFTYHTKFDIDIRTALKGELLQNQLITAMVRNIEACDEVWTVSHGAGENLRSLGFRGEYRVMENGVDFPRGRATEAEIAAITQRHHLPQDRPVFLFIGRMRWYKGIRLILDGLARARAQGARFTMLFVGDGTDMADIQALARENGLWEDCFFAGAVRDRELLRAYYSRADLFLFPSTFDTNGIVVREAAACALPALLVRGSCAAEGIDDGQTGLLMDENAQSLCAQALWACAHPDEIHRIGQTAQERIYISWEDAVRRAEKRYADILAEHPNGAARPRRDVFPFLSDALEAVTRLRELSEQEESAHGVYEEFFRSYNRMAAIDLGEGSDDSSYDDLRRVIMASRYLDRCAQYSIDAAARVLFLLTGQRWNQMEIATFDEDELEGMRVPAGEGAFLDPASDALCVARIPRDELDPRVCELIEGAAGVSPAE